VKSGQQDAAGGCNEVGAFSCSSSELRLACWLDGSTTIFPLSPRVSQSQGLGSRPREELGQMPDSVTVNGPPVNPQQVRSR
jgi:hypothetical protein